MKQIIIAVVLLCTVSMTAQKKSDLLTHYEAYYKQMKAQGDTQGIINAITHLNVLAPSESRKDTLAFMYANSNQNMQALRVIGVETKDSDSNLAVQVRALALKALGDVKRAIAQFEILNKRTPNAFLAYELADLKIQTGDKAGAITNIEYGLANAKDGMKYAFYERQQPYEVPLKAAFLHLKALIEFNNNQANPEAALALINEALAIAPNFNLAGLSKQAIEARKAEETAPKK
ncbi:MAG: hypothetical protein ACSHW4_02920 [Cellulophaga sp.]|uniref:hypothetical protein n=1 Tax=unclassified Cellulophaga TaxID=2634405 RepID=UPI000C2C219E|nr:MULTISPECIES: hypothetical protein [unclassified Cellulophaga]MDO6489957.1 hypothetical protein [Cellulophaga sp. 2_MG-2023]MDO6494849.1 hypothetical protein [Cellulophaga sp. 3_MG-2023]PKB42410.1 hypothetical protein AX016_0577 [Cellulophaga sp. RHA19]